MCSFNLYSFPQGKGGGYTPDAGKLVFLETSVGSLFLLWSSCSNHLLTNSSERKQSILIRLTSNKCQTPNHMTLCLHLTSERMAFWQVYSWRALPPAMQDNHVWANLMNQPHALPAAMAVRSICTQFAAGGQKYTLQCGESPHTRRALLVGSSLDRNSWPRPKWEEPLVMSSGPSSRPRGLWDGVPEGSSCQRALLNNFVVREAKSSFSKHLGVRPWGEIISQGWIGLDRDLWELMRRRKNFLSSFSPRLFPPNSLLSWRPISRLGWCMGWGVSLPRHRSSALPLPQPHCCMGSGWLPVRLPHSRKCRWPSSLVHRIVPEPNLVFSNPHKGP